jgi:hypothetical protein
MQSRASAMLGKCSTTELHPLLMVLFFFKKITNPIPEVCAVMTSSPFNTITLLIKFQHWYFQENIQTIAAGKVKKKKAFVIDLLLYYYFILNSLRTNWPHMH